MRHGAVLRRIARDTSGQAMLETVIVFPVLFIFILVIMELSLLYNGKQLANYAAFCAARTAAVHGVSDTSHTHMAAALAMSAISSGSNDDARTILTAYGVDPDATVGALCNTRGFQGQFDQWLVRLANSYIRTGVPACSVGTVAGRRDHIVAHVTYVYRCNFLPLGHLWGQAAISSYISTLPGTVQSYANGLLMSHWQWNITIHARAITDYWAG
jgi:hypothetical protein